MRSRTGARNGLRYYSKQLDRAARRADRRDGHMMREGLGMAIVAENKPKVEGLFGPDCFHETLDHLWICRRTLQVVKAFPCAHVIWTRRELTLQAEHQGRILLRIRRRSPISSAQLHPQSCSHARLQATTWCGGDVVHTTAGPSTSAQAARAVPTTRSSIV